MSDPSKKVPGNNRKCVCLCQWKLSGNIKVKIESGKFEKKLVFKIYNSKMEMGWIEGGSMFNQAFGCNSCRGVPRLKNPGYLVHIIPTVKRLLNEQKNQNKNRHGNPPKTTQPIFPLRDSLAPWVKNGQFCTRTIWHQAIWHNLRLGRDLCLNCDMT